MSAVSFDDQYPFSTRLRNETRKIHSVSDALVNAKFAISLRDETVWGGGLFVFYHIFKYLEEAKERLNIPELNKLFVNNVLNRTRAFEADLDYYIEDWRNMPKSEALVNYIQHLQKLERENPKLLMAYVYHLYMGLLSGGQILSKKRQFLSYAAKNNHHDQVTEFKDANIAQLKQDIQKAMNEVAKHISENEKEELLIESEKVFLLNNKIVDSVCGQDVAMKKLIIKVSGLLFLATSIFVAYKVVNY